VGTEPVLLALFEFPGGLAAQMLAGAEITRSAIETDVVTQVKRGTSSEGGKLPFTPRAKAMLENAVGEVVQLGYIYVGTEHLLLGIFVDGNSVAAKVLSGLGSDYEVFQGAARERY
jgi:ATP-dependent Clp protease ATP-binding subunit ClpA